MKVSMNRHISDESPKFRNNQQITRTIYFNLLTADLLLPTADLIC